MKHRSFGLYNSENIHPGFSIDCVIISYYKKKLKVLLRKFALYDYWALLGGFMFNDEDADQAAYRALKDFTNLDNIYLKQFHLFSDPKRTILQQNLDFLNQTQTNDDNNKWFLRRFISLGYYALVKYEDVDLSNLDSDTCKWYDLENLPELYSDHKYIIKTSLETLKYSMPIMHIAHELLPEKFTIADLRRIFEMILGKRLDRRNFQRKMITEGEVIQLDEKIGTGAYNSAILYSFHPNFKKDHI